MFIHTSTMPFTRYLICVNAARRRRTGGKGEPEMRVSALIAGSVFGPESWACAAISLHDFLMPFCRWYGWYAQAQLHRIMPMIGLRYWS
ncbi:hypothetical protein B0H19DRAFT_1195338 [Mycena capillaripes]|nr:hypothetical protein B0H19DRAFT_1195338 [Mycena capillaripes]